MKLDVSSGSAQDSLTGITDLQPSGSVLSGLRILIVAPSPPPYGGMAIQSRQLERRLRAEGSSVVFFPSNLPFPPWLKAVDRVPALRTVLRTARIWSRLWGCVRQADVIHVFAASWVYFFAVVCPAILYARLWRRRVNLNYRGGDAREFFRVYGPLIRPLFRMAHTVTTPSKFLADAIHTRFGISVVVVPNILDDSVFRFRRRPAIRPRLLVTRHLEKIYDVESAIRAFRLIQEKRPEASLWIAGTGSQEAYLRGLTVEWNLRNVRFLGHVAHADLGPIYDQCDMLLNASLVDNFPGALLEASAAGLVVVSTGAGGIPYMFSNGESALLVEPGDWEALARAVDTVLASPSLALSLVEQAQAVAQSCHWSEVRKSIFQAYGLPMTPSGGESGHGCRAEHQ